MTPQNHSNHSHEIQINSCSHQFHTQISAILVHKAGHSQTRSQSKECKYKTHPKSEDNDSNNKNDSNINTIVI
jgi:hypothetical protein